MRTLLLFIALLALPLAAQGQVKDSLVIRFKSGDSVKIPFDNISSMRFHTLVSGVKMPSLSQPTSTSYPNPTSGETAISLTLEKPQEIKLEILSIDGRLIATRVEHCASGSQTIHWNGSTDHGGDAPAGTYLYRFLAGGQARHGKLTLRK